MRALSVVSSIISSLRRFSAFLRMQQPYPNCRMNPDLRGPIFPQAFLRSSAFTKMRIGAPTRWVQLCASSGPIRPRSVSTVMAIFELGEAGARLPLAQRRRSGAFINLVVTSRSFPRAGREVAVRSQLLSFARWRIAARYRWARPTTRSRMRNSMIQINAAARLPSKKFAQ